MGIRVSTGVLIFLFFFSVYSFTMAGRVRFGDEGERYLTAQSLVDRHDLAIRVQPDLHRKTGLDGRNYGSYELGSVIPLVPFYALGESIASFLHLGDPNGVELLVTGLFNPLITALTAVVLWQFCVALGYPPLWSWLSALLFGLGTIAWPYSRAFEREPLLGFCLLLATLAVYRFRQSREWSWVWIAGASAGLLVFAKLANVILLPLFLGYLFLATFDRPRSLTRVVLSLFSFSIPIMVLVGIQALSNQVHFGSFTDTGLAGTWGNPLSYFAISNVPGGLRGLLFSPAKSVFLYSLPALLFLPAWLAFLKRYTLEALLTGSIVAVTLLFNAMNVNWEQSSWWGPKYLVPLFPLVLLPIGSLSKTESTLSRVWLVLATAIGIVGVAVQAVAVLVDDREYLDVVGRGVDLTGAIDFVRHGAFESLVIYRSSTGFPVSINPYGVVLILIGGALAAWMVLRAKSGRLLTVGSFRSGLAVLVLVLLLEFGLLVMWVAVPFQSVKSAQGDVKFFAANSLAAEGRRGEAIAMYILALDRSTHFQSEAIAQVNRLAPAAAGVRISAEDLMASLEMPEGGAIERVSSVQQSETGALKITMPVASGDGNAMAISNPIAVRPGAAYELSGWIRVEGVYGAGNALVSLREDDGAWGAARGTDIVSLSEASGWRPFRKTITTLPSTRRLFIAAGLWNTYGTVWVDGLQLAEIAK